MARAMKALAWAGGGLAVVLLAAIVFLAFIFDWNWLRGTVGQHASSSLGRGVAIHGPLKVRLGRVISIHAEDVRVANAKWASQPDMAHFDAIDLEIRLLPLLVGRTELPELHLTRPRIALEKNGDGEANWQLAANPKSAAAAKAALPQSRTNFPLIDHLAIEDGQLSYRDPVSGIDIDSHIATATGGDPAHEQVTLSGQGSFKGEPAHLTLQGGSLLNLRNPAKPYPLHIEATIGATHARVDGTVDEPMKMEGVNLAMDLSGQDMSAIFPIFGIPVPKTRPYSITGTIIHKGPDWTFQDFKGQVGDSDLSGGLTMITGERPTIRATLVSQRLALADLAGFIGASERPKREDRVLPDDPVNLDKLRSVDMDVRFTGNQVEAPGLPIDKLEAALKVENGRARLEPLSFTVAQGTFSGLVELDGRQDISRARLNMEIRRMDLHRFFADTRFALQTSGTLAGRLELAGQGRSTAELLGAADGRATLLMSGGSLSALLVEAAGLDIAKALGLYLGKDKPMAVRCLVADMEVVHGDARTRALVLDTEGAVVTGEGNVNLGDEHLGLRLIAHPKTPSFLSARAPVLVGGTFAKPDVGVDKAAEATRGGVAVALGALLTPLATLIPFLEPGLGKDQNCGQLIQQARSP
ncbi:MAG TPA: AsmA family protein [Magnetospirillum sp.]|jgi:uncharacterized protein involved in outer membrane biogenesis|nr:AsmA family protein [Magnetospirillum sp.]